eukprot:TRINITY_DN39504_c0_g1_i1.p2 TRINITY_DN39504_c0_g1~~TRINITY_DN39504_c0_g1_i1.p2  ORF type:complete len:116 (+),score=12.08 TRINITY_DN39504_c0_g1_i1:265-612(+)
MLRRSAATMLRTLLRYCAVDWTELKMASSNARATLPGVSSSDCRLRWSNDRAFWRSSGDARDADPPVPGQSTSRCTSFARLARERFEPSIGAGPATSKLDAPRFSAGYTTISKLC